MRTWATAAVFLLACPKRVEPPASKPRQAVQLLAQTEEIETEKNTQTRADVEIDTRDFDRTPKVVATKETPLLRLEGMEARLYGDEAATQGWQVDNFVLLEVLSESGQVLSRAAVGHTDVVQIGPENIDSVGRMSFTFEAGEVDVTSLLPEEAPFKVRATALDYSGVGRVSNLYLVLEPKQQAEDDLRGQ
ncbi:MAG: hypothetical protein ACOZIN_00815 [Myxococcota bacterium]